MAFTKNELAALKQRVSQAYHLGYSIANPAEYVGQLGGGQAPEGVEPFSPEHVLHLIELYEANDGKPASTPVEVAPVVETVEETPVESDAASDVADEKPKKSKKK